MPDQLTTIVLIHILLFAAAWIYARFLNQDRVQEWYRPDYVEVTVIGGDVLIGLAIGALWFTGVLPWVVIPLYISLHLSAGIPIMWWQRKKRHARWAGEQKLNDAIAQRELEERR